MPLSSGILPAVAINRDSKDCINSNTFYDQSPEYFFASFLRQALDSPLYCSFL
jgi:hypothetical protein